MCHGWGAGVAGAGTEGTAGSHGVCWAVVTPLHRSHYLVSMFVLHSKYFRILPIINAESPGGQTSCRAFLPEKLRQLLSFFFFPLKEKFCCQCVCRFSLLRLSTNHLRKKQNQTNQTKIKGTEALAEHPWSELGHRSPSLPREASRGRAKGQRHGRKLLGASVSLCTG